MSQVQEDKPPAVQHPEGSVAPKSIATGLLLAIFGAIGFSGKAIIIKLAYRYDGVDPVTLIMLRMLFALPIFLVMAWWASRGKAALSRKDWFAVLYLGFTGYYLSSFLDFIGLLYITASLERLILYLNPTIIILIGLVLFKRQVSARQVIGLVISYGGVVLVFGQELTLQGAHTAWGSLLVFASAITYSIYLFYSGEIVKRIGSLRLAGLASTVACLCCIAQFVALKPLSAALVVPEVVWLSVLNATACTAVPVLLVMMAVERIGASTAAQVGMIGPLSTILMGTIFLGERFTSLIAAGTALVLAGIFVVTKNR